MKDENERHTEIGNEILALVSAGKPISNTLFVRLLKKIIYSGIEGRNKFILTDFPESREQAQDFEANCSKIKAVILAAGPDARVDMVENGLSEDGIDSYFQKDNRLKVLRGWDETAFKEQLGNKVDYGFVVGASLSGKTTVANMVAAQAGGKVLNMVTIAEAIRPRLETEDGPFEGRVPDEEVEKDVKKIICDDQAAGNKFLYLIDGLHHESIEGAFKFFCGAFGTPGCVIESKALANEIESRLKEQKEMGDGDELGEEDQQDLKDRAAEWAKQQEEW